MRLRFSFFSFFFSWLNSEKPSSIEQATFSRICLRWSKISRSRAAFLRSSRGQRRDDNRKEKVNVCQRSKTNQTKPIRSHTISVALVAVLFLLLAEALGAIGLLLLLLLLLLLQLLLELDVLEAAAIQILARSEIRRFLIVLRSPQKRTETSLSS
jgi:hypothetical protein